MPNARAANSEACAAGFNAYSHLPYPFQRPLGASIAHSEVLFACAEAFLTTSDVFWTLSDALPMCC